MAGETTVNGEPMSRSFFLEHASYVPQEDRLWSALTEVRPAIEDSNIIFQHYILGRPGR